MTAKYNKKIFAKNLKKLMDEKGKSRKDVCESLGFSYYTFSDWVNGKKFPRIDKIEMLAEYFHCEKSDLIEEKSVGWKAVEANDAYIQFDRSAAIDTISSFTNNIGLFRKVSNLSLYEIAEELGIPSDELAKYEQSKVEDIPLDVLKMVARHFKITVEELIGIKYMNYEGANFVVFSRYSKIIDDYARWKTEVGDTQFTDDEFGKLIEYAKLLIKARRD